MKLSEIYHQSGPAISFELFPPKTWKGLAQLCDHFSELMTCEPDFVTCTYGAGGSSQDSTLDLLHWIHQDYPDIPLGSHLTCVGSSVDELRTYIQKAIETGISYIVALRGDPPQGEVDFKPAPDGLRYANELVTMLRNEYPQLGILGGGYPETHPEAPSPEVDIDNLKRKVDAGAEVILTQLFYDNDIFFRFRDRCVKAGITVPITPGVLPITSLAQVKRIISLSGAALPAHLMQRLEAHGGDEEGQYAVGVYYAVRQVEQLLANDVDGVHFYVLNKSRATTLICRALNLSTRAQRTRNYNAF